jgi:hypothetical protein
MLLTVHVQVDFAKRRRERTGSYPDGPWSEHIVTVFLACQITIKNVTVKGKTTPDIPKSSCVQNVDYVLAPRVVPHFDNHALADRPMFMDNNARPHRARIVQHFLQQEAVQTIPRPAMSPNLRSIYHPERCDYDVAKMGFKTGAGKT